MQPTNNKLLTYVIGAICLGALLLICYNINFGLRWSAKSADWGVFGDFIGGAIGTIFNLLGVILIYLTFNAQMEKSDMQQFESTFFSLLSNQRDIVKSMKSSIKNYDERTGKSSWQDIDGEDFIKQVSQELRGIILLIPSKTDLRDIEVYIKDKYDEVYAGKESILDHYFRHLYHIVKYTHNSSIKNKKRYVDIIQAQMSDDELFLAFCNGISQYGKEKFFPLMEEYRFVRNIRNRGSKFPEYKTVIYPKTFATA